MRREDIAELSIPDAPGVYTFRDGNGTPLYIGKAASLRDRVKSYFSADLAKTRAPAIFGMVQEAKNLTWQLTDSVLEALICEANLIKELEPRYNAASKDNKSFNYLVITRDAFPRVLVVRGRELFQNWDHKDIRKVFGPYTSGGSLREALKIVRRIFPYADTCTAESGKPCFNRQIGLCPGVCSGDISKKEYMKIVRNISLLFSGKMGFLRKQLERDMRMAAMSEEFEDAATLRRQLDALTHIRDVSLIKDEHRVATGGTLRRIEAYDIAHTSGNEVVGVMTVVLGGELLKSDYRKFKVHTAANNDTAALAEVLSRRLAHPEWPMPKVIVVDGGKSQLNAAQRVLTRAGISIPVVGVVKDEFHKAVRVIGNEKAIQKHEREILLANHEAHRFAVNYHRRKLRMRK